MTGNDILDLPRPAKLNDYPGNDPALVQGIIDQYVEAFKAIDRITEAIIEPAMRLAEMIQR